MPDDGSHEPNEEDLAALEAVGSPDDLLSLWMASDPLTREETAHCNHRRFNLNTESRRVYCRSCKQEIDPFTALLVFTNEWTYYKDTLEREQAELKKTRERLDDLKRQERNAKARLTRAKRKAT